MNDPSNDLKQRIAAAKARKEKAEAEAESKSGSALPPSARLALRAATDLVAAVVVGAFLGYLLDQWLGTTPWFMIAMFFLGFVAGILNIYRWQTGQEYGIGFKPPQDKETDKTHPDTEQKQADKD